MRLGHLALAGSLFVFAQSQSESGCGGGGGVFNAPLDSDAPFDDGPPGDAPTGQRFDEEEVTDPCGRTRLAFRLIDELCGTALPAVNVADPDAGQAHGLIATASLAAPMFRDGVLADAERSVLFAVDGSHLWVIDTAVPTAPAQSALAAGVGQALAVAAAPLADGEHAAAWIAGGDAGLSRVALGDGGLSISPASELPGPALDVDAVEGVIAVAAGQAGLALFVGGPGALPVMVDVGGPAVSVTLAADASGLAAYVPTCDGLVIVDVASSSVRGTARGLSWVRQAVEDDMNHAPAKDVVVGDIDGVPHAFVAAGRYGVVGVDLSDPTAPRAVGNCTDVANPAHYVSGLKRDAQGGLVVAAGERGVVYAGFAAECATGFVEPLLPPPIETVDEACVERPPWEILEPASWEAPPPGEDPVQLVLADSHVLAFGDARRNALRAVDVWTRPTHEAPQPVQVGRIEEPRDVTSIAAAPDDGPAVLAVTGAAGGVFAIDDVLALVRDPLRPAPIGTALVLADGSIASLMGASLAIDATDGTRSIVTLPRRGSPRGLVRGADGSLVVATEVGFVRVDTETHAQRTELGTPAALAPAIASVNGQVVVAAPEWDRARTDAGDLLPEHGAFNASEVLDLGAWRFGAPRRLLASHGDRLLELATLGDRAVLQVLGARNGVIDDVRSAGPIPPAAYSDAVLKGDRAYLIVNDRARYRSQVVTVDVSGPVPVVLGSDAFSGAAAAAAARQDVLFVADGDGTLRVYDIASGAAALLGQVDLRSAP